MTLANAHSVQLSCMQPGQSQESQVCLGMAVVGFVSMPPGGLFKMNVVGVDRPVGSGVHRSASSRTGVTKRRAPARPRVVVAAAEDGGSARRRRAAAAGAETRSGAEGPLTGALITRL